VETWGASENNEMKRQDGGVVDPGGDPHIQPEPENRENMQLAEKQRK